MRRETLRAIYRASKNASTDPTRYHLQHVRLIPLEGGEDIRITATNGHVLVDTTFDDPELNKKMDGRIHFVSLEAASAIKALLRLVDPRTVNPLLTEVVRDREEQPVGLRFGAAGVWIVAPCDSPELKNIYPNVDDIAPKYEKPTQVSFDASYVLRTAMLALSQDGYKGGHKPRVTLEFNAEDPMSPITVKNVHGKKLGVVMPCRR